MAAGLDRTVGFGLISLSAFVFLYYTIWVIVLPFVDQDQPIHSLFPPPIYAVAIPLIAGLVALSLIGTFVLYVLTMKKKKEKNS